MPTTDVSRSYGKTTLAEQKASYDEWAARYERELCGMGYRIPAAIAAVFARFVPSTDDPILDAGCGGGIQAEPLAMLGYGPMVGIDLSDGMLAVARGKAIYAKLEQMALGETLPFDDGAFGAVLSAGTITPGHAPPHSFDELIRVARPGACIVFSLRDDPKQDPAYPAAIAARVEAGRWSEVFTGPSFQSMPYGEPEVTHRIHVYRVAGNGCKDGELPGSDEIT